MTASGDFVTAIILWNTRYLNRAIAALREAEQVPDHLLTHLSPLGWEHVNPTGDYIWSPADQTMVNMLTVIDRSAPPPRRLFRPHEFSVCPLMLQKLAVR